MDRLGRAGSQTCILQEQPNASVGSQGGPGNGGLAEFTYIQPPAISIPRGGGAIRGIDEEFQVNPATGSGSMTVPIATSPDRQQLALTYDSGAGNGPFGLDWSLSAPDIARRTDKGLPRYRDVVEDDTFILSGVEDLVPVLAETDDGWQPEDIPPRTMDDGRTYHIKRYRPRYQRFLCPYRVLDQSGCLRRYLLALDFS